MKQPKCNLGVRHKWTWVKDVTLKSISMTERGTSAKFSRRGVFKCECGERKYGDARSGL